jgi:hypothetical protein
VDAFKRKREGDFLRIFKKREKREERFAPHEKVGTSDTEKSTQETNNKEQYRKIEMEKIDEVTEIILAVKKDTKKIKRGTRAVSLELKEIIEE